MSILFGATLSLLQFLRLYSISTCLSGYLDDTVGPKCQWGNNANKRAIENKKAAQNGWTTMESSASSSTSPSSSSSTNGDNTETYITDETASASDMTPSTSGRGTNSKLTPHKKVSAVGTPDSGVEMMPKNIFNSAENSTPNTPRLTKKPLSSIKNKPLHDSGTGSSSDILNRRAAALSNFNNINRWNQPSHTPQLSSTDESAENNNHNLNQLRFGKYLNSNVILSSPQILVTKNELLPSSADRFKNKEIGFSDNELPRGESSGFQSSRSSFSSCSLNADGEPNSRKASLLTNAFCFTDDEDETPRHKKKGNKVMQANNSDSLQRNPFSISQLPF